jgi:CDGSH-type Zn-finger protein/uncharacterized Fe-S cluster protein YjdI
MEKSHGEKGIPLGENNGLVRPAALHPRERVRQGPARGLPEKRPWIQPDRDEPDAIATVVLRCPSGALQFEREDGVRATPPEENVIAIAENGPLYARGDIEIKSPEGDTLFRETRVALCRCGASQNMPFCDNTHKEIGFQHEGSLGENRLSSGESGNGDALRVVPITNGPYLLQGEVEIRDAAGHAAFYGSKALLCRCGRSENKPFCDNSHARTGWREDR